MFSAKSIFSCKRGGIGVQISEARQFFDFECSVFTSPLESTRTSADAVTTHRNSAALRAMPLKIGNLVLIHRKTSICNRKSELVE